MHWQCRTEDNRFLGLVMAKQTLGEHWHCLFRGDTAGARCMQPPYMLAGMRLEDDSPGMRCAFCCMHLSSYTLMLQTETPLMSAADVLSGSHSLCAFTQSKWCHAAESRTDVTLEVSVPFWIEAEDVSVDITPNSLHVDVRNELDLYRTCWQNRWAPVCHTRLPGYLSV